MNNSSNSSPCRWCAPWWVIAQMAALTLNPAQALATVVVTADGSAFRVEADSGSVAEILDALGVRFGPDVRQTIENDHRDTVSYSGSRTGIMGEILYKYDYSTRTYESGDVEILSITRGSRAPAVPFGVAADPGPAVSTRAIEGRYKKMLKDRASELGQTPSIQDTDQPNGLSSKSTTGFGSSEKLVEIRILGNYASPMGQREMGGPEK